jgi:hypothetical protein
MSVTVTAHFVLASNYKTATTVRRTQVQRVQSDQRSGRDFILFLGHQQNAVELKMTI